MYVWVCVCVGPCCSAFICERACYLTHRCIWLTPRCCPCRSFTGETILVNVPSGIPDIRHGSERHSRSRDVPEQARGVRARILRPRGGWAVGRAMQLPQDTPPKGRRCISMEGALGRSRRSCTTGWPKISPSRNHSSASSFTATPSVAASACSKTSLGGLISQALCFNTLLQYFTGPLPDLHKSSAALEYIYISFANSGHRPPPATCQLRYTR
jgi:hypothetical protein